jgi:hypothetical protein
MELEQQKPNCIPLPHEDQMVQWLREPGSHLMLLNDLPDDQNDKAEEIAGWLHDRLQDLSVELEKMSGESRVTITVKTILSVTKGNNNG